MKTVHFKLNPHNKKNILRHRKTVGFLKLVRVDWKPELWADQSELLKFSGLKRRRNRLLSTMKDTLAQLKNVPAFKSMYT